MSQVMSSRMGAVGGATFKFEYGGRLKMGLDEKEMDVKELDQEVQATESNAGPISSEQDWLMKVLLLAELPY
jgi:hypothetical protein